MSAYNFSNQSPASVLFDEHAMDGLIDVYEQGDSALNHLSESKKQLLLSLVSFIVESGCETQEALGVVSKPTLLTVVPAIDCRQLIQKVSKPANDGGY